MSVKETLDITGLPFGGRWAVQRLNWPIKKPQSSLELFENGAQTWNRTRDTRIFNPLLYQLSYLGSLAILALAREARIKAFDLRLVKELFGWWDVSLRLINFFAIKELFTLLREIGSRRNVHHIETQFID
jgi:hypothetical protein